MMNYNKKKKIHKYGEDKDMVRIVERRVRSTLQRWRVDKEDEIVLEDC